MKLRFDQLLILFPAIVMCQVRAMDDDLNRILDDGLECYEECSRIDGLRLIDMINNGDLEKAHKLIDTGVDLDVQDELGCTALIYAIFYYPKDKDELISRKNDYLKIFVSYLPFRELGRIQKGFTETAQILITKGANLDLKIKHNNGTALMVAVSKGHKKSLKCL